MRQNKNIFLQCCEKCGMLKPECVCVIKIEVKRGGSGIDGKGISELLKAQRYSAEEVKEKQIDFADWLNSEFVRVEMDSDELLWIHDGVKKTTQELYALYEKYNEDGRKYPIK